MSVLSRRGLASARERADLREVILDATVVLLDDGASFAELTIATIVRQAGVSRPTFYAYFRDKRDLILALGDRFERHAHLAADSWLEQGEGDVDDALARVLHAFREQRSILRAIVEASTYDAEAACFWRTFHERFIANTIARARNGAGKREGEALEADAFALVWMTSRSFSEHLEAPRVSDQALLDAVARMWHSTLEGPSPR